jgi:adenylate cyclase
LAFTPSSEKSILTLPLESVSHTVVAGNIGSNERMSYALVGDSVNLASRIQSLNKDFGTRILVSAATLQQLTQPPAMRALPAVKVKGRSAEVGVYALD